jgi:hypothetical protein
MAMATRNSSTPPTTAVAVSQVTTNTLVEALMARKEAVTMAGKTVKRVAAAEMAAAVAGPMWAMGERRRTNVAGKTPREERRAGIIQTAALKTEREERLPPVPGVAMAAMVAKHLLH